MRAVIQRVRKASVEVGGEMVSRIGPGFLVLLGVTHGDTENEAALLAEKIGNLRVFEDEKGKMNRSLRDIQGEVLVVSQFTLYADCRKGRRPSFTDAAPPEQGERLYEYFCLCLEEMGLSPRKGIFGAKMLIRLENDGPVTIILEKRRQQ
ncbi:MAG: D-aminoacyl-tRNA deacylase [Candidatus Euphemobacter frigidus]|nr:D-aminoacyl-tRNA deacylase [Candidatus Euphemobacter frigidus]MDP8275972.1 D-aminoacyl-tRNA deacylase [Candidatus Euphemobacter frigidus]